MKREELIKEINGVINKHCQLSSKTVIKRAAVELADFALSQTAPLEDALKKLQQEYMELKNREIRYPNKRSLEQIKQYGSEDLYYFGDGWNTCIDKMKELNKLNP